jgi:nickel-dependent lactate racemase
MMAASTHGEVRVRLGLRSFTTDLVLPPGTDVLRSDVPEPLADVPAAIAEALKAPIGGAPFAEICREKMLQAAERGSAAVQGPAFAEGSAAASVRDARRSPGPRVVIVVSDNTRPAPYRGSGGILWPLVDSVLTAGFPPESVTVLMATGTHRVLSDAEMWDLFDKRVRRAGVRVSCHDAADRRGLTRVGRSARGVEVLMNREYVEADFRILTGLVEPHLMAGVSGGRKSICPGLLNVESVREFHGPATLADERATDMVLEGNPCHEISLEIARMARPDFILNVTMSQDGRVAGVFAGDMEQAHLAAVEHVRSFAQIPLQRDYDVVVTHAGYVGVNHYQAEKAAQVAAKAVRDQGYLVVVADTTEVDPVGTESYRRMLRLLGEIGSQAFVQTIRSKDWDFVHDQWGVQVWAKLLAKIPAEHILYFSPQTPMEDYDILPGVHPEALLGETTRGLRDGDVATQEFLVTSFVAAATARACAESERATGRRARVAYLADGPHGIPVSGT